MRSVVRTMRLKLTAKNTIGGRISRSSLIKNARRRDLGINGFLSTRGRMSGGATRTYQPNPKSLETFSFGSDLTLSAKFLSSLERARERFGRDVHAARGEGLGGHGSDDAGEDCAVAGNRGGEFLGLERGDETLGHRRPRYVIPLDWDDHGAVFGLADGESFEMGDTGDRRAVVQIGHQLDALLEGDGVVFVLAGRGLTDEFRLTWDVAELREGGDEDRLGGGRNGVVVQEGVGSRAGDAHTIH